MNLPKRIILPLREYAGIKTVKAGTKLTNPTLQLNDLVYLIYPPYP